MFPRKQFHTKAVLTVYSTTCQYAHSSPGQAFEPDAIREMSLALETVCGKLNLALTDDPATRVVATKITELAQRDVRDAPTLSEMTLQELKHYVRYA